ncbi:MAG: dienelactone hydrolase family protein [Parvularculaceae bacterium]
MAHEVFRGGAGPAVLILHELPGMTPQFWRFAHWVRGAGFSVYAPDLFSRPGKVTGKIGLVSAALKVCISREIHMLAANRSSPVSGWLRALARRASGECGGKVGVVGMCMTGNFALSLVLEDCVAAPVASQPSMPAPLRPGARAALHLSADEKNALRNRSDVPVMALRFAGDRLCAAARFNELEKLLGARLEAHVLPDAAANPDGNPKPHAVLTADLIDAAGEPTREAADRVIAFLGERLKPAR